MHLGNIRRHKLIKFLKQRNSGVSGTALDDYTKFSCVFTNLLRYIDHHYNKLKSRDGCAFPEVIGKHSDARIKANNLLEYLD